MQYPWKKEQSRRNSDKTGKPRTKREQRLRIRDKANY
jgi:hypothetical protein